MLVKVCFYNQPILYYLYLTFEFILLALKIVSPKFLEVVFKRVNFLEMINGLDCSRYIVSFIYVYYLEYINEIYKYCFY
jgi:hypothetical protein